MSATPDRAHGQDFTKPFVHDDGQARSLHFTKGELQSRMNRHSPWQLEVDYTLTMMGFLLLQPAPASIAWWGWAAVRWPSSVTASCLNAG